MKTFIKNFLKNRGYELRRFLPANSPVTQIVTVLTYAQINIVFDIGANRGQFAREIRQYGYRGRIVSFEPLSSVRKKLLAHAAGDHAWEVHEQSAIGDRDGEVEINIAGNSVSSSLLPMLESHSKAAKTSTTIDSEIVPLAKLDSVARRYLISEYNLFLKIDTQGFEWQVLDGACETLREAQGILCELSLVQLYDKQRLWRDIVDRLHREGFMLWAFQNGFSDPKTGQILQMDGIFLRYEVLKRLNSIRYVN
jgi:FkbM family methyltransferase